MAKAKQQRGAQSSHVSLNDLFHAWIDNHREVVKDTAQRMLNAPISTLLTWLVLAIALALPTTLYLGLTNVSSISSGIDQSAHISLYLKTGISEEAGRKLAERLPLDTDIRAAQYISKEQALAEFRQLSGFNDTIDALDNNPLPAVILIQPSAAISGADGAQQLLHTLQQMKEIELAQLDLEWVQRLQSMMELAKRIINSLALLLGSGVLIVIGNTIRLAIESRRDEIVIVKLVGATDTFVRRPFLYTGLIYGLGGAILAWVIVFFALLWFSQPIIQLADLYHSDFQLRGLDFVDTLLLLLGGSMLGWIGAWLAVTRHLGSIQPR
ncbi:Cell division protein FtsX [Sinobacterium norvegicum]|uniref:Cell division protein FtsX n=1 Tax=Sinobacterium norvegicum TaxID=1641715 RepID=A0ABM9AIC2_9GAMM|nr:permease-like cell division protein FtsX [Sinobacterium norvegicum]CAH0992966.1 Cell division protein FtsX [Sinobacterium norvegicum]